MRKWCSPFSAFWIDLLFIFFCEDHPDRLLNHDLVKGVVERAVLMPGRSHTKAYDALKQLFHDLDTGVEAGAWRYHAITANFSRHTYYWIALSSQTHCIPDVIFGNHLQPTKLALWRVSGGFTSLTFGASLIAIYSVTYSKNPLVISLPLLAAGGPMHVPPLEFSTPLRDWQRFRRDVRTARNVSVEFRDLRLV